MATIYFQRVSYETAKSDLEKTTQNIPNKPRNLALKWNLSYASERLCREEHGFRKALNTFNAYAWIGRGFASFAMPSLSLKNVNEASETTPLFSPKAEISRSIQSMLNDSGLFEVTETDIEIERLERLGLLDDDLDVEVIKFDKYEKEESELSLSQPIIIDIDYDNDEESLETQPLLQAAKN